MSLEKEVFSQALLSAANSSLDVVFSEELIISCRENKTKIIMLGKHNMHIKEDKFHGKKLAFN